MCFPHSLEEVESRHSSESREQEELVQQLRLEVTEVTVAFRSQLQSLQEDHQKNLAVLREELAASQERERRLQKVGGLWVETSGVRWVESAGRW